MVRIAMVALLASVLSGCGLFSEPKVEYKYVNKPVPVCPPPHELNGGKPVEKQIHLAIFDLTENSSDDEVSKAYQVSIKQLQGHVDVLYNLLMSYDRTSAEYQNLKRLLDTMYPDGSISQPKTESKQ